MSGEDTEQKDKGSIIERLASGESFYLKGSPTISDFQDIINLSERNKREYGIQINNLKDQSLETVYSVGKEKGIVAPEGFYDALKVFFHTHWRADEKRSEKSVMSMTPSYAQKRYSQFLIADFGNTFMSLEAGGYQNIVSPLGITFLIGKEKHSKEAELTANIRNKINVANETSAPIIFIKSGEHKGELIDEFSEEVAMANHLGENQHLLFTVRIPQLGSDYNMLFVKYEALRELGVTSEELCFKNGVNILLEKLGVEVAHSKNLYRARAKYIKEAVI